MKNLCQRLRTASEPTKKAMSTLFPACANVSSSKKRKFDPTEDCIVASQQQKKKAVNPSYKGRSKALKVIILKELPVTIPRGPLRERLRKAGRIKELHFHRVMSEEEVNSVINSGFEDLEVKGFKFLTPLKDNRLALAKKQGLDGNAIIALAGSGSVYLQESLPVSHVLKDNTTTCTAEGLNMDKRSRVCF